MLLKLFLISIMLSLNNFIFIFGTETANNNTEHTNQAVVHGNDKNSTKDLYVIRKVVYEIGILTDAGNTTDVNNKTHEQIDVSLFDPLDNGTFINLSNIPVPIETNVSGVAVTGILASPNLGNLIFPNNSTVDLNNASNFPILPDKQVKITRNISTTDKRQNANILSGISDILGIHNLLLNKSNESGEESSEEK